MDKADRIEAVYQAVGAEFFAADDLRTAVSRLNADEAAFVTLIAVGAEIENGGFPQLFTNSTGDLFEVAIDSAERFGLNDHAQVLRDAGLVLFPDGVPPDQQQRLDAWDLLDPDDEGIFDDAVETLDERWYSLQAALTHRLFAYAATHDLA